MTEVTLVHPVITGFWLALGFALPGILLFAGVAVLGAVVKMALGK